MQSAGSSRTTDRSTAGAMVVTQMGGLGDVVLTSKLISALRRSSPSRDVVLICRKANEGIVRCFPDPPTRLIAIDSDPPDWTEVSPALMMRVGELRDALGDITAADVIAAEYRPHWFSLLVAEVTGTARAVTGRTGQEQDPVFHAVTNSRTPPEWHGPEIRTDCHLLQRLDEQAKFAGVAECEFPTWTLRREAEDRARAFLAASNLGWKQYTVVVPFGAAGAPIKRWPAERFTATLNALRSETADPLLLLGNAGERDGLEELARSISSTGPVAVYAGSPGDLETVCGLVAGARAYFGNDTGPMHIAGAFGVPGVAIYGGGHWPAYKPWSAGMVGFVEELPCFGCSWDCVLGHALCVEAIEVPPVLEALRAILAGRVPGVPSVVATRSTPAATLRVLRDATARYRESQSDRAARYRSIVELHRISAQQRDIIEDLVRTADERLYALDSQTQAYADLAADAEKRRVDVEELTRQIAIRDARIQDIERESDSRLKALEVESGALAVLRREADLRKEALEEAERNLARKDELIDSLGLLADERLRVLNKADVEFRELQGEAAKRGEDVETLTSIIAAREQTIAAAWAIAAERLASLDSLKTAFDTLASESEERARGLDQLTATVSRQREDIAELRAIADERLKALEATARDLQRATAEGEKRAEGLRKLTDVIAGRDARIAELDVLAAERLNALLATNEALKQVRAESEQRKCGLEQLTVALSGRDAQIAQLTATSEKRLQALLDTTAALEALRTEADTRADGLQRLTEVIHAKNAEIAKLRKTAEERLDALERMDAAVRELRKQAEDRLSAIGRLTPGLGAGADRGEQNRSSEEPLTEVAAAAHDRQRQVEEISTALSSAEARVAELERTATERLDALGTAQRAIDQWQTEAASRLAALEKSSEIIAARDARIVQLEKTSEERLQQLVAAADELKRRDDELTKAAGSRAAAERDTAAVRTESEHLGRVILRLKRQIEILEAKIVALEEQNLYNFLVRRWGATRRRPPAGPQT